jgi:RNA polymerase sigma-70 factor, ECF subfamily
LDARDLIHAAWTTGAATYPTLAVSLELFESFAAARIDAWRDAPGRAADLYLACACSASIEGAAVVFLDTHGDRIATYLGRIASCDDQVEEVRQRVLVRCLIGDEQRAPAITSYSGRGSLEGWVRATAVREGLALIRDGARHVQLAESALEKPGSVDRTWLVARYREPVQEAFSVASTSLPREHRALLRLHYVHGLTTNELARMYRISRSTLVRRLAEARDALVARLAGELEGRAGIAPSDCTDVLRLLKGQIDLRLSSLLRETAA